MSLLGLLIVIFIIGVIFWCTRTLIAAFQIPEPIASVIYVVLTLFALLFIVGQLGYGPATHLRLL